MWGMIGNMGDNGRIGWETSKIEWVEDYLRPTHTHTHTHTYIYIYIKQRCKWLNKTPINKLIHFHFFKSNVKFVEKEVTNSCF